MHSSRWRSPAVDAALLCAGAAPKTLLAPRLARISRCVNPRYSPMVPLTCTVVQHARGRRANIGM
jgi:hypothetical protein